MELLEYWYLFLRRKNLILSIFLVCFLIGIIYAFVARPVYQADCTLLVTDVNANSFIGDLGIGNTMLQSIGKADPVNTQMELIKRRPIINRVIEEMNRVGYKYSPAMANAMLNQITVESVRNTNLISVSYQSGYRSVARDVVDTVARVFVEQNQQFNREEISSARDFIEKQLKEQKEIAMAAENAVISYKSSSGTVSLPEETSSQLGTLSNLEASKMDVQSRINGARAQKNNIEAKINDANSQSSPFYSYWMKSLEEINNQLTNLSAQLSSITADIIKASSNFSSLPVKEMQLARLVRDERLANEIYVRLLSKYDEVRINQASKIANIRIVEPAVLPIKAVAPQKKKIILLSMIIGLMAGFGVALILEYLDDKPRSMEDVKKILPYPVLGQVPLLTPIDSLFALSDARSQIAESVRLIHSNLKFAEIMNKPNVSLMVASALADEGKSTLLFNLAITVAKMEKKTVFVDVDLRRSSLKAMFPKAKSKGVTDYLIGEATLEDIIYIEPNTGLAVISAGTIPPNPAELLSSKKMFDLIAELKKKYDITFFDMPPLVLVSETLVFGKNVDGIILVVDMVNTSLKAVKAMQDLLHDKNLPVLGVVYNKLSQENNAHGYSGYKYEYS